MLSAQLFAFKLDVVSSIHLLVPVLQNDYLRLLTKPRNLSPFYLPGCWPGAQKGNQAVYCQFDVPRKSRRGLASALATLRPLA